jgi:hypothetical protein
MRINQTYSGAAKGIVDISLAYNDNANTCGWGVRVTPIGGPGGNATTGAFYYDSSSGVANYATHYGIYIKNTGAGTGDQRYGGYFEVTSGNSYVSNYGVYAKANTSGHTGLYGTIYALRAEATSTSTGTTASVVGAYISSNDWINGRCLELSDGYSVSASHILANISRNSSVVGSISTTLSSTAYNTSSDYRLKENIKPVNNGIARLQQLKPSRFNFIADPDKTVDGFIAHEVQTVVPEAITGEKDEVRIETYEVKPSVSPVLDEDGNEIEPGKPPVFGTREVPVYQGIDQSKLVPLLTAALQEAIGRIETLEAKVAALKSQ